MKILGRSEKYMHPITDPHLALFQQTTKTVLRFTYLFKKRLVRQQIHGDPVIGLDCIT